MMATDAQAVAEGLWQRLRDALLVERRLEAFEFSPESPGPGRPGLAVLARDAGQARALARDLVLRALSLAADSANHRLLEALRGPGPVTVAEAARHAGLPEMAARERLAALAQAGLAGREAAGDLALATPAGLGLASLVDALSAELAGRIGRELPGLLAS
jgi:hypothetical protein